jgi:hypothetical protein
VRCKPGRREPRAPRARYLPDHAIVRRITMGLGRGLLLWLIGIPLPIILLLALFWR